VRPLNFNSFDFCVLAWDLRGLNTKKD
jgi:hypothetical protein